MENKRGAAVRGFHQFHPVLFLASHLLLVLETRPLLGELRYVGGVGGLGGGGCTRLVQVVPEHTQHLELQEGGEGPKFHQIHYIWWNSGMFWGGSEGGGTKIR